MRLLKTRKYSLGRNPLLAQFRPFHGIRFNPNKISDLADVICPPYDIISPAEQEAYYRR
ncbi:MAG: DUF1015 family protein, partial [Dehalococcoidia bacterium]|nr:DUF1015 family protein [Dehalococcoidia bacterium]